MNAAEKARIAREEAEKEAKLEKEKKEKEQELQKQMEEKEKQDAIDLEIIRKELKKIVKKKVGKVVTFGRYMQKKKDDPIEWIVLKNVAGEMTLLSKYVLDCMNWTELDIDSYDGTFYYKDSRIREFLNNDFYNMAFASYEKMAIKLTKIDSTCRGSEEDVYSSDDYVYLLSGMEIEYIKENILKTKPTKYAESKFYNNKWWLRDSSMGGTEIGEKFLTSQYYDACGKYKVLKFNVRFADVYSYHGNYGKFYELKLKEPLELQKYGIRPVITIKTDI